MGGLPDCRIPLEEQEIIQAENIQHKETPLPLESLHFPWGRKLFHQHYETSVSSPKKGESYLDHNSQTITIIIANKYACSGAPETGSNESL